MSERLEEIRARLAKWQSSPDAYDGKFALLVHAPEDLEYLLAELDAARATNTRLNARCTKADAVARKTADELRAGGHSFGRALANWAAQDAERRLAEMKAELDAARGKLAEAWDEGYWSGWRGRTRSILEGQTYEQECATKEPNPYKEAP